MTMTGIRKEGSSEGKRTRLSLVNSATLSLEVD